VHDFRINCNLVPPDLTVHERAVRSMIPDNVGVIAIGRNEGERLVRCLESVRENTSSIVYVDSGSTDSSVTKAKQIGAFVVTLDLAKPFTAGRARNEGFRALKRLKPDLRFVQFVDGDCILVHGWLDKALEFIEQRKDIAAVCGRRRERYPTASVYNQLCDFEWDTPIGEAAACGGDALVRVEAFEAVGGFRPEIMAGEEPELCVRLRQNGWRIWRLDLEMTQHDAAMKRFGQWWFRAVRAGYGYVEVSQLHRTSSMRLGRRQFARAVGWGGLLPVVIGVGAVMHPVALAGVLIYVLQICRIAFVLGSTSSRSWKYALFIMVAKFAEFQGVVKYYWRHWQGRAATLIEYK
jgi:GT2 family glycosyltransferase